MNTTGMQARTLTYTTDTVGQVMQRIVTTNGTTSSRQFYFYFNGRRIGEIGNDGTSNIDYTAAINADGNAQGPNGNTAGTGYADFDQNYAAIDPSAGLEGANGTYVVHAGDTLSAIAPHPCANPSPNSAAVSATIASTVRSSPQTP